MRTLITGVTGFVGGHLADALLAGGAAEVHGVGLHDDWPPPLAHLAGHVRLHTADMADAGRAEAVLPESRPDRIYHLAGFASPAESFRDPDAAWAGNLAATRGLYDAVARWGGSPRILFISSGMVYGATDDPDR